MLRREPVDATTPNPRVGQHVWLRDVRYDQSFLETAWLFLQEADGFWAAAVDAMLRDRNIGWDRISVKVYVTAAQGWTGNVVAGEVR